MTFKVENKALGAILSVRWTLSHHVLHLCWLLLRHPFDFHHLASQWRPIHSTTSVTMQCVFNLTFQFFFIYLMIWICVTIDEFTGFKWQLLIDTMKNVKGTVAYCPMLAILFVGTRKRDELVTIYVTQVDSQT